MVLRSKDRPTQGCQLGHLAFDPPTPAQGSFSIPSTLACILNSPNSLLSPLSAGPLLSMAPPFKVQPHWIPQFSFSHFLAAPSGSRSLHTCPQFAGKRKNPLILPQAPGSLPRPLAREEGRETCGASRGPRMPRKLLAGA